MTDFRIQRPRLVVWGRLLIAILTLLALLLNFPLIAGVALVALIVLLLLPLTSLDAPTLTPGSALHLPLIEEVTRQLSSSLSIGQVANIVLSAALRATHAETATLAMPVEVDQFMTIQLRQGQESVQIIHPTYTGDTLIEQVLHQGRLMFSRDRSTLAMVLRHEYLVIGALSVENKQQPLTQTEADLVSEIAVPAAISLHNATLLDDQQYQIETLSHIQALTLRLAAAINDESVAEAILETTRDILGVQEVALYRWQSEQLEPLLSLHRDRFSSLSSEKRLTQAVALKTAQTGKVQVIRQPMTAIAIPVERGGAISEVLAAAFIEHHVLHHRDLSTLTLLANQAGAHLDTVELHERARAVSESLLMTINSAQDGVLLFDRETKLLMCNPAAERLLGIDKDALIGKHYVAMLFDMTKASEQNGMGYSRSELTELARQLRLEPERVTRRQFDQISGGQTLTLEEIGSPVFDSQNEIVGRMIILRDMTEQKMMMDFRSDVTHMAVHDLRGPLTAVINGIDMTLMLGFTEYPEDSERVLKLSLESARGLMQMINGLLEIARLESRSVPVNSQPIAAAQVIESARKALDNSLTEAQIHFQVALDNDLPLLNVDEDLIRRVLINLIDNALRFTPQGGEILITSARGGDNGTPGSQIILSVADSGPGIPPDEWDHVFEQYRQSSKNKAIRGSKGTGLGLTFCKLAVEAHGGRIWVDTSETLPGACFKMSLPVIT